jgi:hypothetical protein
MRCRRGSYRRLLLYILFAFLLMTIYLNLNRSMPPIATVFSDEPVCFKWNSSAQQKVKENTCLLWDDIISTVWTHDGTGMMKYIQWIITRKIGNVRITQLNSDCQIIEENSFSSNSKMDKFVQIYIVSLESNFNKDSTCSIDLLSILKLGGTRINQIYFKRKSIKATMTYQHLDKIRLKNNSNFDWNISLNFNPKQGTFITEHLLTYFKSLSHSKSIILNAEDLIHSNSIDCEKAVTNLLSLLGFDTSEKDLRDIIEYDSHQFTEDATWWDQSQTIEHVSQIDSRSFTYSNDFYHLHGNKPFIKYVSDSRQCFNDGIFPQLQSETKTNRSSTDKPERCFLKPFDCAFSDIYSFSDREELYSKQNSFNSNPIKCAFAIKSVIDKVRNKYQYNNTCQTIVYTCITNCYDPLPSFQDSIPPQTCFVALLDTKTKHAIGNSNSLWDLIDLEDSGSLFRVPAKITETLKIVGYRMFPLAKWIVWLDGKAFIINIKEVLTLARTPVIGLKHSEATRTSQLEVEPTIDRVKQGQEINSLKLNISIQEIQLQEEQYKKEGFYSRSNSIGLGLYDIAIFIYRNNHPCISRYLCGWHNEINYYAYRGQLSVYYPAERLNVYHYLGIIQRKFYHTLAHRNVC